MIRILSLGVFAGALTNFALTLGGAPAGNADIRQDSIFGDWRLALSSTLFDKGEYLFQIGYGFANAEDSMQANTDPDDPYALARERAELAVKNLRESLALTPGNVHAWSALAWSEAALGNIDAARQAMAVSWQIAPYNSGLAVSRPEFVAYLGDLLLDQEFAEDGEPTIAPISEAELSSVAKDLALLAELNPEFAAEVIETSDVLFQFGDVLPAPGS